jgi:hypothetical protein
MSVFVVILYGTRCNLSHICQSDCAPGLNKLACQRSKPFYVSQLTPGVNKSGGADYVCEAPNPNPWTGTSPSSSVVHMAGFQNPGEDDSCGFRGLRSHIGMDLSITTLLPKRDSGIDDKVC